MKTNEREFLLAISKMPASELIDALSNADADEARVLRIHLGEAQYADILRVAGRSRGIAPGPGRNVVVLHGIMGGELTLLNNDGQNLIWVNALRLIGGQFDRLALDAEGRSAGDVIASGIYMRYYASQIVRLGQDWRVRPFFYDWRQDIRLAADALLQRINTAFGPEEPVHLVAHSMGGLVARCYIKKHPDRWNKGGRLVMLGTPNFGSFAIPRLLFGTNDVLSLVKKIDFHHSSSDLLNIAKTFTGAYQMLPVEGEVDGLEVLYRASTYNVVPIEQSLLDQAKAFQKEIASVIDPQRMIYVAGYNRRTMAGITDPTQLGSDEGYLFSRRGDGTVPHNLGLLPGIKTFFVDEEHINLPGNKRVQNAMNDLLEMGDLQNEDELYKGLGSEFAGDRGLGDESQSSMRAGESARRSAKEQQALALRNILVGRGDAKGETLSMESQALEDLITRHDALPLSVAGAGSQGKGALLATPIDQATLVVALPQASSTIVSTKLKTDQRRTKLRVRVVQGNIDRIAKTGIQGEMPIDCLAVGHYLGVRPTGAELDLDRAISAAYPVFSAGTLIDEDFIFTQFHDRGILRGDLGVPFYLPDLRAGYEGTLVAIAGLGPAGRFGVPELTVVARELCWSLGRMGKKHLATVLIGSGSGNLSVADAIHGWMVGLNRALLTAAGEGSSVIEIVTFVIRSNAKINESVAALKREASSMGGDSPYGFDIELKDMPEAAAIQPGETPQESAPTRISIEFQNGRCRYSALTETASIPERVFDVPSKRIDDINRRILATDNEEEKYRLGKFLLNYLFPQDLRSQLVGGAPVVLACNNEAAKVYWELAAQPDEDENLGQQADRKYLGLARGLTRQLRTVLAPPPEPLPPVGRVLRVLVVANGSKEHPLPGAQQEARLLLDLFDRINCRNGPDKISATALIGPANATALDVLLQINEQTPFDVLHYAGHCVYNEKQPELSGFLFSNGDMLTARDLDRIDRTPKFVFANACESGVLPSRPDLSSPELPAAFAEAFFKKGVANFICTAWPVGDAPSRDFALKLYAELLGDNPEGIASNIYTALREARRQIVSTKTWAAYQHYGNPYFRLFRSRENR
jgi:pimeloyl-ACP methyl ester carboxylesterase